MPTRPSVARCRLQSRPEVELLEGRQLLNRTSLLPAVEHAPLSELRTDRRAEPRPEYEPFRAEGFSTRGDGSQDGWRRQRKDIRWDRPAVGFWEQYGNSRASFGEARGLERTRPLAVWEPVTVVVVVFTPTRVPAVTASTAVAGPRVERGEESAGPDLPTTTAAAIADPALLDNTEPLPNQAAGVPSEPAPSNAALRVLTVSPPSEGRLATLVVATLANGASLLPVRNDLTPARATIPLPEFAARPAREVTILEELPFPKMKPAEPVTFALAAEAADVLTHALSVSLATLERALGDLARGPQAEVYRSGAAVLYWLGLSSWAVGGAFAYEMVRRRARQTPSLAGYGPPEESDPFLEGLA